MKLVLAQGNPEPKYANTRHNVGFAILNEYTQQLNIKWEEKTKLQATTAEITINHEKIILAKPTTYYNETGLSVRAIIDFYKLNPETELLVIYDDLSLPFGTIRTRKQGSDAGNNGIKSINSHLKSDYARIKIGTNNELRAHMDDATFVLSKFSKDENSQLKLDLIPKAIDLINSFCHDTLETTSLKTN